MMEKRNRSKKYLGIADTLDRRIAADEYKSILPSRRELAEEFKVNNKTIDRAVKILVGRGLLIRVQGRGTFIVGREPEDITRTTRNINTRRYAFTISRGQHYGPYLDVLNTCDELVSRISGMIIFANHDAHVDLDEFVGRLRAQRIEGVFALGKCDEEMIDRLVGEFNVVLVDTGTEDPSANSVAWDNPGMGRGIGQGLIEQDCKGITFVMQGKGRDVYPNNRHRYKGLKDVADEAGIPCSLHHVQWDLSDVTPNCLLAEELKGRDPERHALVTPMVEILYPMLGRLDALSQLPGLWTGGLATPEQLDVLPRGVYAVSDMHRLGRAAADVLTAIIGRPRTRFRHEVLKADIHTVT